MIAAAVGALALAGLAAWSVFGPPSLRERAVGVRDSLRALRARVDSCRMALANEEAFFRRYDRRVDSLRTRIREYESLDPRGVPQDSFEAYMDAFEDYNEAVPGWEARAESLRVHSRACRRRVRAHNVLTDSLRGLLVEMGELEDTVGASR